ncbi:MAG: 7-cyano-7-deazaguanine synthase QueC [Sedimentisphaerales bacterium]|nr:7-cyano-7-deazaguanine synthase QueC [Sedimentisphaerales bacterium]
MPKNGKKAIVLLSGGLDSATTLGIAIQAGFECYAITFRYGQRHSIEINSAKRIAKSFDAAEHRIIDIDLAQLGGSALTDSNISVPKNRPELEKEDKTSSIPITYVPARNTIFLSYALAWAEVLNISDIFIGVNITDYSGYPDCRGRFIEAFENMANLATAAAVKGKAIYKIHTPIINMSKADIIKKGTQIGVNYSLTHSCYDPDKAGRACGQCDSCRLRRKGFKEAGLTDPAKYSK